MAHTGKRVHTFSMSSHERVFNIDYTLGSGRTPGAQYLTVNDMKYDYGFRAITLMSLLIFLVWIGKR